MKVKNRGIEAVFKALGEVDALRFFSLISSEKRDYLKLQDKLFKGMRVEEIFEKAEEYSKSR